MERRAFLKLFAGGAAVFVVACVPEGLSQPEPNPITPDAGSAGPTPEAKKDATAEAKPEKQPDAGKDASADAGTDAEASRSDDATAEDARSEPDAGSPDAEVVCNNFVEMHDTYAQALYFDGTLGPLTGTIKVDYILVGQAVELEFWHGHDGVQHKFTVTPEHFETLKRGERVELLTTTIMDHEHRIFIDPMDPNYRVPDSPNVRVPLC